MKSNKCHYTRHDLPEKTRREVIELLNQQLADVLDLGMQAKQAHWNVKGPNFISLHELFDKVADEIGEFTDEMAERLVALGGVAQGTVQAVNSRSRLKKYPLDITSGPAHVAALADALATFAQSVRAAIDEAGKLGDAGTSDLFTGISTATDKLLWMVESHADTEG
jgi:starvation-inducible DNA-binding protein